MSANLDHLVIFSGDGDFRPLIEALQRKGKIVTVVSSIAVRPPMIADELRRQADFFIDIADLKNVIGRAFKAPPQGGDTPIDALGPDEDDSFEDDFEEV